MFRGAALWTTAWLALIGPAQAADDFTYVDDPRPALAQGAIVIDTRPLAACRERSFAGARCLPAEDALGPHRSLPSWRDLLWLFATVGLTGRESVLVVGADALQRDFVAGLLYTAGQARVSVLSQPIARLLAVGHAEGPGRQRAFARDTVYEATMRDDAIVLARELRATRGPILDGRSADEYWGQRVRATRGGHIAGAMSAPLAELRGKRAGEFALAHGAPIAYAHDAVEGFAYFTLLRAALRSDARVYPNGWAEWAADAALPADAITYPEPAAPSDRTPAPPASMPSAASWIAALVLGLTVAFVAGLLLGRAKPR